MAKGIVGVHIKRELQMHAEKKHQSFYSLLVYLVLWDAKSFLALAHLIQLKKDKIIVR